jgi:predicted DsbA family dithiol-disulfide isomerase
VPASEDSTLCVRCPGTNPERREVPVLVEIWSDVVCPWCAIGKARFERALDAFPHREQVEVRWRSFELDPARSGTTDVDYVTMLAHKYGTSRDQAQAMIDRMTAAGVEDSIDFRFDLARPGNTFDAHRVLHLAADRGRQYEVKDRFLAGYHSEGIPIADHGALTELATGAGLDADEVGEVLRGEAYADAVRGDEQQAHEYGIRGVPFFVLDRRVGISGAQPSAQLLAALTEQHATAADVTAAPATDTRDHDHDHSGHAHAPGEACVDGVCAV